MGSEKLTEVRVKIKTQYDWHQQCEISFVRLKKIYIMKLLKIGLEVLQPRNSPVPFSAQVICMQKMFTQSRLTSLDRLARRGNL